MARSVGEAIANGLESGIGLALRLDQNKRSIAADARAEERMKQVQAKEDAAMGRQQARDGLAALGAQRAGLANEVQASTDAGIELPPTRQMAIAGATKQIDAQMNRAYADMGGADIDALTSRYDQAIAGMKEGKIDAGALSGPEFGAVFTQATGFTPKAFMRGPGGEPSQIEQAAAAVQKGIEGGDQQSLLSGLNVLLKPNIDKIVGRPSAHGGTIVGAELAALHDDPNGSKDDPRVVPMLKVFVREEGFAGPAMENGATGFYMAPVTEGRETGGSAKVKSISLNDGFEYLGKNLKLVEALNSPEAAEKVREAYATPGMTPEDWQSVRAQLGVKRPKRSAESFTLKRGDVRVDREIDATGKVVPGSERRTAGEPASAPAARQGSTQQTIAAIDDLVEDGTLTEEEGKARKRALVAKVSTGTRAQGLAGGGGSGGGKGKAGAATDAPGLTAAENRLAQRKLQSADQDLKDVDKREDNATIDLREFRKTKPGPASSDEAIAAWKVDEKAFLSEHKKTMSKIAEDRAALRAKKDEIERQLDGVPATGAEAKRPAGEKASPGGKPVLKFDKDGNRVTN